LTVHPYKVDCKIITRTKEMDTTHKANIAEDLISHKLQRSGLLVAKPKFDHEGADLLVLMNLEKGAKFCRVQCKGRSLLKLMSKSHVEVPKKYIQGAFLLVLFIDDGEEKETNLFCFFQDDIENRWKLRTVRNSECEFYRLSFSKASYKDVKKRGNLLEYYLTNQKIEKIKRIIREANIDKEFGQMFALLKNQDGLIKLQKEKHKLEGIIREIKHTEEIKNILEDKIKLMEERYEHLVNQFNADKSNNPVNK
jgi:hypothetical protein